MAKQKEEVRKRVHAANLALDPAALTRTSEAIGRRVLALPEYVAAEGLFVYVSVGREIDTHGIIRQALAAGKRVAVPRCIAPGVMELREIKGLHQLETARFGLLEPGEDCPTFDAGLVDFALVPCAACDAACNRLGKGGGYYDRTLQARAFPAAALCRESTLLPSVPMAQWDQPVDIVVTEQRVIRRPRGQ